MQRNVKAPTQSLGQSMDRRQPINRELSDLFDTIPVFEDRVEYLKDNPGKLSAKLFSFKTVRLRVRVAAGRQQVPHAHDDGQGNQ